MNSLVAVMLLVSCTDGFSSCTAADDMVRVFPTETACEASLVPTVSKISTRGEQIFAKCLYADPNLIESDLSIYWRVTASGDLIVDLSDEDSDDKPLSVSLAHIGKPSA